MFYTLEAGRRASVASAEGVSCPPAQETSEEKTLRCIGERASCTPCTAKNPLVSAFAGLTKTRKINITSPSSLPLRLTVTDGISPY